MVEKIFVSVISCLNVFGGCRSGGQSLTHKVEASVGHLCGDMKQAVVFTSLKLRGDI